MLLFQTTGKKQKKMKRDYPLSTTPNPSPYDGGRTKFVSESRASKTIQKTRKNLDGTITVIDKYKSNNPENGRGGKTVRDKDKTTFGTDDKANINYSDMKRMKVKTNVDNDAYLKGKTKLNFTNNNPTSSKQKDSDLKVGYRDSGMMAKTDNYSKDRAKEVLKSVGKAVKKVVSRKK